MAEPRLETLVDRLHRHARRAGLAADRGGDGASTARPTEPDRRPDGGETEGDHLAAVPDGAGCTEIWEHLSERQAAGAGAVADD